MKLVRLVFTSILCFAALLPSFALDDSITVLISKLNNSKPIEKTTILNRLAKYYQDSSFTKATYYAEQAIECAKLVNDSIELADAYYSLGYIQLLMGENSSANKNLTKAYNLYHLSKNKLGIARCSDNLGSIFRYAGSLGKALEYHLNSLSIFYELKDTSGIVGAKNNLGILYRNLKNNKKSISYYQEALDLALKSNNKLLSTVFNSIGSYYWYKGSNDSALYYYRKALSINPQTLLLKERHCAALNNIGNVYRSNGNLDSAIYYYKQSLQKSNQYDLINLSSVTLKNFGAIFNQQGKCNEALKFIEESISLAKKSNLKRIISDDYLLLSDIYSKQGDYRKAFEYHKQYSAIQDSIFNDEQANKITQLEVDFVLQQKKMDNAVLSKNIAEQNLKIQKTTSLLTILSLIIAFLILLSFTIYRLLKLTKKSASDLREMNEELEERVQSRTLNLKNEIEEHKLTASALLKAKEKAEESDRLKSFFLANLSHEIRTPMNAIQGFTSLLLVPDLSSDMKENYISIIKKSGNQLLSIINDIVEISKIDAGQIVPHYSPVNIYEFINDLFNVTIATIPKEKDIELRVTNPIIYPKLIISTDEVKLLQVMTNLINNALKFTEKGFVSFGYEVINGKVLKFFVQDTGVGIDEKHRRFIFERFRQVEGDLAIMKGGSGLGLAISKAYTEMLGGIITLESELGKGSIFSFTIPLIKVEEVVTKDLTNKPLEKSLKGDHELILIVEDDDIVYLYFEAVMSKRNYKLIRAINGIEAVDICSKNNDIRLVLMDIKMPVMNGYEALKRIRQIKPHLNVIAQTSYALPEDRLLIDEAGFNGYITKPIVMEDLFQLIDSCFDNQPLKTS